MKNLMKMIVILMMIGIQTNSLKAQAGANTTGIYLTAHDYKAGQLSYTTATHLSLNNFLGGSHIIVLSEGKKLKLAKAEIFGYRVNGTDFRFYHSEVYQVLDTAGFMLYSHAQLMPQGKGYITVNKYFYSTGEATSVNTLTIANICNSFSGQADFRYSVEDYFRGDIDLAAYDKLNKQYQIKYLYFEHQHHAAVQHASL
jgi:hypothetical protein